MIGRLAALLRAVFRRDALEREMHEEMQLHLERASERYAARGMSPDDARRAARREFGNVGVIQEDGRDARGARWVETTLRDIRYAVRALRRTPVFTLTVILSLALGIGANTAIFGVIHALIYERLPVPGAEELVLLRRTSGGGDVGDFLWDAEYRAVKGAPGVSVTAFTGAMTRPIFIGATEERETGGVIAVDGDFFAMLGVSPSAGRLLNTTDESEGAPVAVISQALALRHFGSAGNALGKEVTLNRARLAVVGVTPAEFRGLEHGGSFGIAVPLAAARRLMFSPERTARGLQLVVIGRAPTASVNAAIAAAFESCCGSGDLVAVVPGRVAPRDLGVRVEDISRGIPAPKLDLRAEYSRALWLLMAAVAVLLLIACANVGNLLLARAASRTREVAVRLTLGASRWRVVRQLLVESLLLAGAAAALGLALAVAGTRILASNLPEAFVRLEGVLSLRLQLELLGFTIALAVTCAAIFGILPALRATRRAAASGGGLREMVASKQPGRLDRTIVAVQVALALVLVSAAGLLAGTLRNLRDGNGGFDSARMVVADIEVRGTPYAQTGIRPLHGEILRRVRMLAAVQSAGLGTRIPLAYGSWSPEEVTIAGYEPGASEDMNVDFISVTPGYLESNGIAMRAGRDITDADRAGAAAVVVVSEAFARRFFGGRDPVGMRFTYRSQFTGTGEVTIVGVAADAKYYDLRAPAQPAVYRPFAQAQDWGFLAMAVRTPGTPDALIAAVRGAIEGAAPGITVRWVRTMDSMVSLRLTREQTLAWLATMFAVLAVAIAAIGLYGVQAYQVAARTSEIGIRMALGADGRSVVWLVLRQAFFMVLVGAVLGVPLAIAGGRAMGSQLYGIAPWEPTMLGQSVLLLAAVGIVASLLPALRATRVDPLSAIRVE